MTTIDTTLYCDGELRLAKHGAGKGGTVLTHVPSGEQINLPTYDDDAADRAITFMARRGNTPQTIFTSIRHDVERYGRVFG